MSADLRCADCLGPEGMATLADGSVDVTITDPPYARDVYLRASAGKSKKGSGTPARLGPGLAKLAAGAIGNVDEMIEPAAREIARVTRRWAVVFSDAESIHLWRAALVAAGMRYIRTGAWVKPDSMPQMTGDRPAVGMELCTIVHGPAKMRWNGGGNRAVWTFGVEKQNRPDHPCPKPIALMEAMLADFTDPGELIMDPFAGSGTTGFAAQRLGRKFIGWERDLEYHRVATARMARSAPLPAGYQADPRQGVLL